MYRVQVKDDNEEGTNTILDGNKMRDHNEYRDLVILHYLCPVTAPLLIGM